MLNPSSSAASSPIPLAQPEVTEPSEESPRTHKKDKQEVIGQVFETAALEALLQSPTPLTYVSRDYQLLLKAYRGLPLSAFGEFLNLYQLAGYDLNPVDAQGVRFADMLTQNVKHLGYAQLLLDRIAAGQTAESR